MQSLAEQFTMTLSAVSQHLGLLRAVGLVEARRVGRQQLYHLTPGPLRTVADWIGFYEQFWRERLEALGEHLKRNP